MKIKFKLGLIAMASLLGAANGALSQDFPNKPLKLYVGYTPGSSPDILGRLIGSQLTKVLGQPFLIENKPGAGATTAAAFVAGLPADGYNLVASDTGQIVIATQVLKVPFHPLKDFTPVGFTATTPVLLLTSPGTGMKTVQEVLREAKAHPGKLNYGSNGRGAIIYFAFEAFKYAAGLDITHIAYKGNPQVIQATLAGEVQLMIGSLSTSGALIREGKLHALAVVSKLRPTGYANVPMLSDLVKGYDGYPVDNGILAPAGLPPAVLNKLSGALKIALETPETKNRLEELGFVVTWSTPEAYSASLQQEYKKYEREIKRLDVKAE